MGARFQRLGTIVLVTMAFMTASAIAQAGAYRYFIASQQNWEKKLGFSLEFANNSPGDERCGLPGLNLSLYIADGKGWKSISPKLDWTMGKEYVIKAVITPKSASLSVDGVPQGEAGVDFKPALTENPLANGIPDWAASPADYAIEPESLRVASSSGMDIRPPYRKKSKISLALDLLESPEPKRIIGYDLKQGETLTIEAVFLLSNPPETGSLGPLIDKYGQSMHGEWPGKVKTDHDLRVAIQEEKAKYKQWKAPTDYDVFGGYTKAGWKEKPTGYFKTIKRNGYWWLISPKGNPCFYKGLDVAPDFPMTPLTGREGIFRELPPELPGMYETRNWGSDSGTEYVSPADWNLLRKFGQNWRAESDKATAERLRMWGFSGIGKWSTFKGFADIPVLNLWNVTRLSRHPDIFDPSVRDEIRESLSQQMQPRLKDPYVVGWSIGNEYDEIINKAEITEIMKGSATSAKTALSGYALKELYDGSMDKLAVAWKARGSLSLGDLSNKALNPPPADIEKLRRRFADEYYAFLYGTVKAIDPNHLYFGNWIAIYWWENEEDWNLVGRHCDVIGYDRYGSGLTDADMDRFFASTGKPVLCGEFSFPVTYSNTRGFGTYPHMAVSTEKEAAEHYAEWMADAAANPYVIGLCWFQYRDQYLTGRGPGTGPSPVYGEHYAYGLVDITDRAKWTLVEQVRKSNLGVEKSRLLKADQP